MELKSKNDGVREYTRAMADIYFVKGEERCKFCPMLQTYSRPYCQRTGELIVDTLGRGQWCPLVFEEEKEEQIWESLS